MIHIKVNSVLYPATVSGKIEDREWDNRQSKSITLNMTYSEALALLPDGTPWSIVQTDDSLENAEEWDNSEYSMSGDITDHRDGTVTIKMGEPTDLEEAYEMLIGG